MRGRIKKIMVWTLLAAFVVSIATRNPTLVVHILGDIFGPPWNVITSIFHHIHAPHKTIRV